MASSPSLVISVEPYTRLGEAPTQSLPVQAQAVSLPEPTEAIPRRWLVIGGIVIVILIIGAILLAISSSGNYKPSSASASSLAPLESGAVSAEPATDRELKLKALLHDLQNGKTCPARKAAIGPLVELADRRAIEPLKIARYRMQGGIAGFGADNVNACLTRDAETAIKALSALPVKPG
jgi:hypothetical protein